MCDENNLTSFISLAVLKAISYLIEVKQNLKKIYCRTKGLYGYADVLWIIYHRKKCKKFSCIAKIKSILHIIYPDDSSPIVENFY